MCLCIALKPTFLFAQTEKKGVLKIRVYDEVLLAANCHGTHSEGMERCL